MLLPNRMRRRRGRDEARDHCVVGIGWLRFAVAGDILRPAMRTTCADSLSRDVRRVLEGPCACPCIAVDSVRVVAGTPVEVDV